ncbi:unnamed protein product [Protopolystoma xenopodis]|uniref:Suppressor of fused C-terminal domain-containing protein n=1 Tax=Protopolystoma xenopodis TaxID=117903 RepID=A0A448XCI8_9PLAT|nr:unnamed protein product [Protopolystoma xenopodis]
MFCGTYRLGMPLNADSEGLLFIFLIVLPISAKIHFEEPNSDRGLVDSDGDVAMTATSELGQSGPSVELGVMTVDDEFIDVVGDGDSLTTIYPSTIPATPAAGMSMRPGGSTWNTSAACEPNDTSTSNSTLSNHTPLNCFWPAYPSGLAPATKHASGPGSAGSAPCTPLAQLSLSSPGATAAAASFSILDASRGRSSAGSSRGPSSIPTSAAEGSSTSLELVSDPTPAFRTWLSGADVWLDIEAARVLRLAVTDRLRHGRHFTFVDAQRPNCAVSLVPAGLPGSEVSASRPMCAQGNWLQIYIPDDFLSQIEADFAKCLPEPSHMDNLVLPVVFRWHKHCLRLCLVDSLPFDLEVAEKIPTIPIPSSTSNLSHPPLLSSSSPSTSVSCQPFSFCATKPVQSNVSRLLPPNQAGAGIRAIRCPETNANSDGIPVANSASESIRGSNSLISGSTPQIPRFLPGHIPPPAVLASWMGQMQTAPLPNQSAIVCSSTTPLSQPGPDHHHAHPHYPYQLIQPHAQQQQQQQTGSQPGLTLLGSGPESSLLSNRLLSRLPNLDSNISEAYSRPSTLDASLTTSKVPSAHGNDFVQSRPQGTPPKNVSTNVGYPPADPAAAYSGLLAGFWQMFMMMANTNSSMTDNQPMGLSGTSGPPTNDMNAAAACAEAFIHGLYPTNKTNI